MVHIGFFNLCWLFSFAHTRRCGVRLARRRCAASTDASLQLVAFIEALQESWTIEASLTRLTWKQPSSPLQAVLGQNDAMVNFVYILYIYGHIWHIRFLGQDGLARSKDQAKSKQPGEQPQSQCHSPTDLETRSCTCGREPATVDQVFVWFTLMEGKPWVINSKTMQDLKFIRRTGSLGCSLSMMKGTSHTFRAARNQTHQTMWLHVTSRLRRLHVDCALGADDRSWQGWSM